MFLGQRISIILPLLNHISFSFMYFFFLFRTFIDHYRTDSLLVKPRSYHSRAKSQSSTRSLDHEGATTNPTNIAKPIARSGNGNAR